MTDEYLIAMLRNNVGVSEAACRAAKAAADRIEQLVAEKDAAAAAAYEVAAQVAQNVGVPVGAGDGCGTYIPGTSADAARAIRALSTPDQSAALDAVRAEIEALERAAEQRGREAGLREAEGRIKSAYSAKCRENDEANFERRRANSAEAALKLASNRLAWASVQFDAGTRDFITLGEWADEARTAASEACTASDEKINWRDDPTAIVEDDEPQTGREYQ